MPLADLFHTRALEILSQHSEIEHTWSLAPGHLKLKIPTQCSGGFEIQIGIDATSATVGWGNWHTHFNVETEQDADVDGLLGLLRDLLSPDMRITERRSGNQPYRGVLESFDGVQWSSEQETGLLFWNYFGRSSVRTFSNSLLPGRMAEGDPETVE